MLSASAALRWRASGRAAHRSHFCYWSACRGWRRV